MLANLLIILFFGKIWKNLAYLESSSCCKNSNLSARCINLRGTPSSIFPFFLASSFQLNFPFKRSYWSLVHRQHSLCSFDIQHVCNACKTADTNLY